MNFYSFIKVSLNFKLYNETRTINFEYVFLFINNYALCFIGRRWALLFTYSFYIILFSPKLSCWENWNGDIYPIFHGEYFSNMEGSSSIEEYKYWHFENITILGIDIYSNRDLLLTYASQISNNPLNNSDIPSGVPSLVRIDSTTGKTVWAKQIINHFDLYYFEMIKSTIINDVIWWLNTYTFNYFNAPGVITRIDGNGSIIEIFYTPFTITFVN